MTRTPKRTRRPLNRSEQSRVLDGVLRAARLGASAGVAVFDLDSTLFDNRPRQARILREFGEASGLEPLTRCQPHHFSGWSLTDAMVAAGLDPEVARQQADPARQYWRERFFTSEYCKDDVPITGAVDYLHAMRATGIQIAYVSGRHVAMADGTIACMRAHGFPLADGERVHLLLKPGFDLDDDAWKVEAYGKIAALGTLICAFDNEPAHVNGYAGRFPGAHCVHLATDDSGRDVDPAPGVPSIANFER